MSDHLPRQTVLFSCAPESIHLHALDVRAGLNGVRIWHEVRETCTHNEMKSCRLKSIIPEGGYS